MSILNNFIAESSNKNYSLKVTDDPLYLLEATSSAYIECLALERQTMIADTIGEYKVLTEGAEVSVVVENILKDGWEKLKGIFKKLKEKIIQFFNNVKKMLQTIFSTGEKFISEFGNTLRSKETKGFSYKAFPYKRSAGDSMVDSAMDKVYSRVDSVLGVMGSFGSMKGNPKDMISKLKAAIKDNSAKSSEADGESLKLDDLEDNLCSEMASSCSSVSEVTSEILYTYRGDEKEKVKIEEFKEGASVSEMIDFIKGKEKTINAATKDETNFINNINKIISTLDKVKSDDSDVYKYSSQASSAMSKILSIGQAPLHAKITVYKEMANSYLLILKGFNLFKAKKESYENNTIDANASLFEQASRFM